jgi:GNAT superfamily N-acetyltransferase
VEGIRDATSNDLTRITGLYEELKLELSEYRGRWLDLDAWPEPAEDALAAAIAADDVLVSVGTIDGYVVGYVVVEIRPTLPQASTDSIGRVRDLFVEVEARGVGVGEALLSGAIDWLTNRGIRAADVSVLPGHRAAKNFFEENGFVARSITMHGHW